MSGLPLFTVDPAELERMPRWRRRIDWLRRAAEAQHPRVLERESIGRYSYDELEQLGRAVPSCVQRYLAGIRKTAKRDLGVGALAPAVHLLVRGEGYLLPASAVVPEPPAANETWSRFFRVLRPDGYNRALRGATESLPR